MTKICHQTASYSLKIAPLHFCTSDSEMPLTEEPGLYKRSCPRSLSYSVSTTPVRYTPTVVWPFRGVWRYGYSLHQTRWAPLVLTTDRMQPFYLVVRTYLPGNSGH
jgi:hypothetical protein